MELEEFKRRKQKLESDLRAALEKELTKFKEETGLHPEDITVCIMKLQIIGEDTSYILEAVKARFDLCG